MKNKNKDLGKRIKMLRHACDLSQDALADELFVARTSISNYENNRRSPDIELLQLMCEKFGVSMNYLLGNITEEDEKKSLSGMDIDIRPYLTKDMHLDLSKAPPIVRIFVVEIFLFMMQKYNK